MNYFGIRCRQGLPWWLSGKESACNAEIWVRSLGWKMPWRRKWQPTPVTLPRKSHGQRSLAGCSPWDHKESDTTEQTHFHWDKTGTIIGKQWYKKIQLIGNLWIIIFLRITFAHSHTQKLHMCNNDIICMKITEYHSLVMTETLLWLQLKELTRWQKYKYLDKNINILTSIYGI